MSDPVVGFDGLWEDLRSSYANEIRDFFLHHDGFVEGHVLRRYCEARERVGMKKGGAFTDLVAEFLADGTLELHGDNYVNPIQFHMACRDTIEKLTDLVTGNHSGPTPSSH